ncbi:centromere protein H [Ranitomeya imitator]|uniref:centromere protein H n=1 Tax=Ranitomeya imitator TaxID=111125 RepID=UPI0037E918D5
MARAQAVEEQRADMAGDLLVSLEQQSVELGRLALSRAHKPEPAVSTLLLLKELKKLKQQKFDLETRIRAEELSTDDIAPEHLTIEKLTEIIEKLKNEIKKEKVAHHNNSLLLRRLQIYNAIRNKLSEKTPESQMIYETMKHTRGLCDQIQALKKESRMLAEQMIDIRHQRMQLKETCTTLMAELRVMKEEQNNDLAQLDNPEFKKTRDYIKKETDTVTVLQNVFQRLILSSGVNWAEDPNLKEILLKMGEKNPPCS